MVPVLFAKQALNRAFFAEMYEVSRTDQRAAAQAAAVQKIVPIRKIFSPFGKSRMGSSSSICATFYSPETPANLFTMISEVESLKSEPFAKRFRLNARILCLTQKPEPARSEPRDRHGSQPKEGRATLPDRFRRLYLSTLNQL
jgi:hypothetical protein